MTSFINEIKDYANDYNCLMILNLQQFCLPRSRWLGPLAIHCVNVLTYTTCCRLCFITLVKNLTWWIFKLTGN